MSAANFARHGDSKQAYLSMWPEINVCPLGPQPRILPAAAAPRLLRWEGSCLKSTPFSVVS